MSSTSYPVHEPVQEPVPFLRSSLENVYVVSHEDGKLFHLKDLKMTEEKLPEECEPGCVFTKNSAGEFEYFELDDSVKEQLTYDPELLTLLNKMIVDSCTGKTNYDVAWWVGGFNNFMAGFCNHHYDF